MAVIFVCLFLFGSCMLLYADEVFTFYCSSNLFLNHCSGKRRFLMSLWFDFLCI